MGFRSPVECAGCGEAELILGIDEMHDRIMTERAEAEAKAARLFYGNQGEPIFLIDHADELARMRARAYELALAIDGLELREGRPHTGRLQAACGVRRRSPLKREGFWFGAPPEGWVFPLDWLPRNA